MNKKIALLILSLAAPGWANADWYAGGSIGDSELDSMLDALGVSTASFSDTSSGALEIFGGWTSPQPYLSLETAFNYLGGIELFSSTQYREIYISNVSGVVKLHSPLGHMVSVGAFVGFHAWNITTDYTSVSGSWTNDSTGVDPTYGVGVNVSIVPKVALRFKWQNYELDNVDIEVISLGAQYTFGGSTSDNPPGN